MVLERPASRENNEEVTRRGALQFLGKVAASMAAMKTGLGSIPGAEAAEKRKTPEEKVDEFISLISRAFGKNGSETRVCKTGEGLDRDRINTYLNWMSAASGGLEQAHANTKKPGILEKYLLRKIPPGLLKYRIGKYQQEEILKNARPEAQPPEVGLNSYLVTRNNKIYEVTVRHGTNNSNDFFSLKMGPDVAVREVTKKYGGQPILDLNSSVDDEDLSGKIGIIVGTDIRGNLTKIHTPFIRMTPAILETLYPGYQNVKDPEVKQIFAAQLHTYFCVLPPHFGLRNEYNLPGLRGLSGSFSGVMRDTNDVVTTGPVMAVQEINASCTEFKGLCTTIGFVSTRKSVVDVIDTYESQRPRA